MGKNKNEPVNPLSGRVRDPMCGCGHARTSHHGGGCGALTPVDDDPANNKTCSCTRKYMEF